jgi:hypothetical protein
MGTPLNRDVRIAFNFTFDRAATMIVSVGRDRGVAFFCDADLALALS